MKYTTLPILALLGCAAAKPVVNIAPIDTAAVEENITVEFMGNPEVLEKDLYVCRVEQASKPVRLACVKYDKFVEYMESVSDD